MSQLRTKATPKNSQFTKFRGIEGEDGENGHEHMGSVCSHWGGCIEAVVTFRPCESSCATELVTTPATSIAVATRILLREE